MLPILTRTVLVTTLPLCCHHHQHLSLVSLFLLSNSLISLVNPFNIDWNYPIIIKTVADFNADSEPNYFGSSVDFLKDGSNSWIIIGASKANSSQHPDVREPGALWQCSLGKDPAEVCYPVVMDPTGNDHDGNAYEWKNGSLLGSPNGVVISSKSLVACASRLEKWVEGIGKYGTTIGYMHGSCYVRPKTQLFQQQSQSSLNDFQHLNPLQDGLYEGRRTDRFGQAGFAVHFSKTGDELVMTAPGLNRWMGSVIQFVSRDGGEKFTKSYVSQASTCPQSGVGCFDYLGYSLTSGYYYERNVNVVNNRAPVYYATGVPRANNLAGKVIIFRFPDSQDEPLEIQQEIFGNLTGAYFGSSLLSVDLNGDGYDDLVVGSPRFSRDQRAQPRARGPLSMPLTLPSSGSISPVEGRGFDRFGGYGDEGAIFIYFSRNQGRGELSRQERILRGGNKPWSHFGTAMASLGDLNRDGYNDFAVAAPFEDTTGAVYIYFGNKDNNIKVPDQVIYGKAIDSRLRGFGYSLAGNVDIDNNGFTDIAIGSFNSSQVVVLRAKPVITVHGSIKCSMNKLSLDILTFTIRSCVSITGDYVPPGVQLIIKLEADAKFQPKRVRIRPEDDSGIDPSGTFLDTQTIRQSDGETCTRFVASVTEPLESSGDPVVFTQTIEVAQGGNAVKTRTINIPPKTEDLYTTGAKFSDFCKTCPVIKEATISHLALPLAIPCGDDDRCQSDLHLKVAFKGVDLSSGSFFVGSSPSIFMEIQLSNRNETAIQPGIMVTWWKLKLKRTPTGCSKQSERGTEVVYRCSFGKFLEKGNTTTVTLEFDMTSLVVSQNGQMETELFWNVTAQTVSEMWKPVTETIALPLSYQADPYIEGSRRLEVFNMDTKAKYLVFTQVFEVSMEGPSPVTDLTAIFKLPVNVSSLASESDGAIVNVRTVKINEGSGTNTLSCKTTKGHFSKSDDALGTEYGELEYDDPDFDAAGFGGILPKDKDVSRDSNSTLVEEDRLLLHCGSPFVACIEVTCKVGAIYMPEVTEVFTFVIDIASDDIRRLMKTYKVSSIQVESEGKLILSQAVKEIQPTLNKPDEATAITLIERDGYKPISKWIYVLAVVIGILVLVCVVFCLYACGCFEDKRPQDAGDMVDGNASGEELQPLHEKEPEQKTSSDANTEERCEENDQRNGSQHSIATSPFSDVFDPPEFVPTEPTIPEESENDYEAIK